MRHKKIKKRTIESDKIYKNRLITKFINKIMKDGKKTVAESSFYSAMDLLKEKGQDPLQTFEKALQNVSPRQEVKARRVGGASYQVPSEVRGERKVALAIRWLVESARARSSKDYHTFAAKLAAEFSDASQNLGTAIKKRDAVQRTAEANKAFSHFRW